MRIANFFTPLKCQPQPYGESRMGLFIPILGGIVLWSLLFIACGVAWFTAYKIGALTANGLDSWRMDSRLDFKSPASSLNTMTGAREATSFSHD